MHTIVLAAIPSKPYVCSQASRRHNVGHQRVALRLCEVARVRLLKKLCDHARFHGPCRNGDLVPQSERYSRIAPNHWRDDRLDSFFQITHPPAIAGLACHAYLLIEVDRMPCRKPRVFPFEDIPHHAIGLSGTEERPDPFREDVFLCDLFGVRATETAGCLRHEVKLTWRLFPLTSERLT